MDVILLKIKLWLLNKISRNISFFIIFILGIEGGGFTKLKCILTKMKVEFEKVWIAQQIPNLKQRLNTIKDSL